MTYVTAISRDNAYPVMPVANADLLQADADVRIRPVRGRSKKGAGLVATAPW